MLIGKRCCYYKVLLRYKIGETETYFVFVFNPALSLLLDNLIA